MPNRMSDDRDSDELVQRQAPPKKSLDVGPLESEDGHAALGWTAAHQACQDGEDSLLDKLLSKDPSLAHAKTDSGHTLLHVAVAENRIEVIHILLERQIGLNAQAAGSLSTPAHMAVRMNCPEALTLLVTAGCNLGVEDAKGETPVGLASRKGRREMVVSCLRLASKRAASFVNTAHEGQLTLLHDAAWSGDVALVDELLALGANVAAQDAYGNTCLHAAAQQDKAQVVPPLVRAGCPISGVKANGFTALHDAACFGHSRMISQLIASGAAVDARTDAGSTSLHIAAEMNAVDCFGPLLAAGLPVDVHDHLGWTPLHVAAHHGNREAVEALLQAGAAPRRDANRHAAVPKRGLMGLLKGAVTPASVVCKGHGADKGAHEDIIKLLAHAVALGQVAQPQEEYSAQPSQDVRNSASTSADASTSAADEVQLTTMASPAAKQATGADTQAMLGGAGMPVLAA